MLTKTYHHTVDIQKIDSLHAVTAELEIVSRHLENTELHNLKFFNNVYTVVAGELEQAIVRKEFIFPELITELDIAFSLYYFDALNYFAEHKRLPELWNDITQKKVRIPFYFLLGANVHINHDLPLAILDTTSDLKKFRRDFFVADKNIACAIKKFFKITYRFSFIQYFFGCIVRKPITLIILAWRHQAWQQAELLTQKKLKKIDLIEKTKNIARKIIYYGKCL